MRQILAKLIYHRFMLTFLLLSNTVGAIWGFYWYKNQFAQTPLYAWPFIPNSPLAVLYFVIVLVLMLLKKSSVFLEGLAYFGLIKHGLWTVAIVSAYRLAGFYSADDYFLWVGHSAMALQAVIFWYVRGLPLSLPLSLGISAWFFFNDFLDYGVGIHPFVNTSITSVSFIRNLALIYTISLTISYLYTAYFHQYRKENQ